VTKTLYKNITKHGGNNKLHSLMGSVYKQQTLNPIIIYKTNRYAFLSTKETLRMEHSCAF